MQTTQAGDAGGTKRRGKEQKRGLSLQAPPCTKGVSVNRENVQQKRRILRCHGHNFTFHKTLEPKEILWLLQSKLFILKNEKTGPRKQGRRGHRALTADSGQETTSPAPSQSSPPSSSVGIRNANQSPLNFRASVSLRTDTLPRGRGEAGGSEPCVKSGRGRTSRP